METGNMNERTSRQKRAGRMRSPHQRLWWLELARGVVTFAFGLLFLSARSLAPRLFIYSLGVYLVIDGLLELSDVRRRKGISQLRPLEYVGGAMSLLTGLLSLMFPTVTLYLLVGIIAVRLVSKGLSEMRIARRARGPSIFLPWAYSGFFVLLSLFLFMLPLLAITLLVVFLGGYMLVAGLFLVLRGLSLRFRSRSLPASLSRPPQAPPGLNDDLPPSTRRAVVFVRRAAADGLGHIAWGFEWMNGWFAVAVVLLLLGVLALGLHRRPLTIGGLALGTIIFLLSVVGALVLAILVWVGLKALNPNYQMMMAGSYYGSDFAVLGLSALVIAAMSALFLWLRTRMRLYNLAAGVLVCWAALLLLSSLYFPGGSYLFTWPLLGAVLALG
jgi:uncharacterized membrane protein HdeD (DUF308 family)